MIILVYRNEDNKHSLNADSCYTVETFQDKQEAIAYLLEIDESFDELSDYRIYEGEELSVALVPKDKE